MNFVNKLSRQLCSFLALIFIFALVPTASAQTAIYGAGKVSTKSGSLNVRSGAGTGYSITSSLSKGSTVTLIKKNGSFWYVEYSENKYGYCSDKYIETISVDTRTVKTSSGRLNVRSGASTGYAIKDSLPGETPVTVLSTENGFCKILYKGNKTGYVSLDYLKKTENIYNEIYLKVPDYKQTDARWRDVTLGSSGQSIGKIGCATTALAMTESFRTGYAVYPDAMSKKLSYTAGGAVYWPESYNIITNGTNYLDKIYSILSSGKPVILGAKNALGGQHYVVITGVTATQSLTPSAFLINDPGSAGRTSLSDFLFDYPSFYKMLYPK